MSAQECVHALQRAQLTVAVAESVTGGLVLAALTDVPGASAVVRGGIVAYATDLKASMLRVPVTLLADHGPVHPDVAAAMATGVAAACGADIGLATTGVAGPTAQGDVAVGVVYVAVAGPAGSQSQVLHFAGDRGHVRALAVTGALKLLLMSLVTPGHA